jgi:hypothetical protein
VRSRPSDATSTPLETTRSTPPDPRRDDRCARTRRNTGVEAFRHAARGQARLSYPRDGANPSDRLIHPSRPCPSVDPGLGRDDHIGGPRDRRSEYRVGDARIRTQVEPAREAGRVAGENDVQQDREQPVERASLRNSVEPSFRYQTAGRRLIIES